MLEYGPFKTYMYSLKKLTTSLLAGASLVFHTQFRVLTCHLHILILQKFLLVQKVYREHFKEEYWKYIPLVTPTWYVGDYKIL